MTDRQPGMNETLVQARVRAEAECPANQPRKFLSAVFPIFFS